ncbi:t-SNARE [Phlyctochytrium arcticum]|nr:t-SNARE [Phlyctochytrium arcticum]
MATRSRTLLFLQYRNSFSRTTGGSRRTNRLGIPDTSERAGLIANEIDQDAEVVVELSVLPPKWIDIVDEVEEVIDRIKARITELESLHKKHLLPGFDDSSREEQSIERLTDNIGEMFRECERKVKKLVHDSHHGSMSKQNEILAKNIQTSLATKLQELSSALRKTQTAYLQKLRGRELRNKDVAGADSQLEANDDELDAVRHFHNLLTDGHAKNNVLQVFSDAQIQMVQNNERAITEREREINEIVKSMLGVAEVFRELHTMVIDQGTVLDRIDYNIELVNVHVEEAHKELLQGKKYQDGSRAKLCIIVLVVVVVLMFLILIFKRRSSSSS